MLAAFRQRGGSRKNYLYSNLLDTQDIETQWEDITRNAKALSTRMLKYFWVSRSYITGTELYRKLLKQYGQTEGLPSDECWPFLTIYYAAIEATTRRRLPNGFVEGCDGVASNQEYLRRFVSSAQGLNLFKIRQHFPLIYSITKAYERTEKSGSKDTKVLLRLMNNLEQYHFVNNQICDK